MGDMIKSASLAADVKNTVSQTQFSMSQNKSILSKEARLQQINEKAEEFESVFLSQMMSHMFEGIETDELFGGGESEDIYRSFMVDEYGKLIAKSGGIGIADHVKRQMLAMQEKE